jgi:hypothetical protein
MNIFKNIKRWFPSNPSTSKSATPSENLIDIPAHTRVVNGQKIHVSEYQRAAKQVVSETEEASVSEPEFEKDGAQVMLGNDFASSQALRDRGFNDAFAHRSGVDYEISLTLLEDEYQAYLHGLIEELKSNQRQYEQGNSSLLGVSDVFDQKVNIIKSQYRERIADLEIELEEARLSRTISALKNAYRKGYSHALEVKGHRVAPVGL